VSLSLPIDVIVPVYNGAGYLRDSLGSIAAQTCGVHEVIVVDDGSTDDTATVARSLGARVVTQHNAGVAVARNTGIRASRAPFLALLDVDDRWHPEHLEAHWRAHEVCPDVSIVSSDYAFWTGDAVTGSVLATQTQLAAASRVRVSPEAYVVSSKDMVAALGVRNFVLPSTILVDRQLFDRDAIYFRPRVELAEADDTFIGEDYEWLMRALRVTGIAFVDRVLVDYRQSGNTLSARRGRIRYGDVVLGRMIAQSPSQYADGAAEAMARHRPLALRESALRHFKSGEFALAAARLREFAQARAQPQRALATIAARLLEVGTMRPLLLPLTRLRRPRFF
jgi:glycosyltransferase involved in cell wall biosynthesis